ncbi:MAG TPA: TolC family protein [Steroidobacteraceae bacterium]|nr:TolC family protein [Steroidobacteraceae bacterium]
MRAPLGLLLALLVGAAGSAAGETLEQAWQMAAADDQSLAAAGADLDAAKANERAARDARWPSLAANAGYTRLNASPTLQVATPTFMFESGPIFRDNQYVAGTVQMKLPLYAGGQISAGIDAAHHAMTGASEYESATAAMLKLDVAESYVGVLRARRALQAAASSVQSLTAHVSDVQQMVEGQTVAMSDLLAARVALANAEQGRVRAASAVEVAQAVYNRRLGQPLERVPELEDHVPGDASLAAMPIDSLVTRALESRSELKSVAAQAAALASQSRAEIAKLRPQVALTGGYTHFDNQILNREDFSMVGVGFSWSLFDGGQARNRADALNSASRAQKNRLNDLRSQTELEVRQSWLGVQEAQARVKASSEAVAQAEENLRMSRELYGAGLASNTQVLDAVTLQVSAVNNRDNAVLDESLSQLRLAYAVGAL